MKSLISMLGLVCMLLAIIMPTFGQARTALEVKAVEEGRAATSAVFPNHDYAVHQVGEMQLYITNFGIFGRGLATSIDDPPVPPSCEYPKGSNSCYLFGGAFWVGAVVGQDTLVSVGHDGWSNLQEMYPDEFPGGGLIHRSLNDPLTPDAVSEEDIIGIYYDTLVTTTNIDEIEGRWHRPLGIRITQNSYAWSYPHTDDFVLFDMHIENIGVEELHDVYIGIYVDGDVGAEPIDANWGYSDDICGFLRAVPIQHGSCTFMDTVNLAWLADNNGDPYSGVYEAQSVPHVTATSLLRTPSPETNISFNWWLSNATPSLDFGPRERAYTGAWEEPFRDFTTGGLGTPSGDRNKYYIMRNREFDYDQIWTAAIGPDDPLWLYPPQSQALNFSDGYDTRYLLSFGPFDISPGQSQPLSFAYVGGKNLHTNPDNLDNLSWANYDPNEYYWNLDFSDLVNNRRWASWVYDTPGYDTDGDGYAGKMRTCCTGPSDCEQYYYEGDGVPDFKASFPPQAPMMRAEEIGGGRVMVKWNGLYSETTPDMLTKALDFEGYNVYFGLDDGPSSLALLAAYDLENFTKFVWVVDVLNPNGVWRAYDNPYLTRELRCLYASSCDDVSFVPQDYTADDPLAFGDSLFYFAPVGANASEFGVTTPIEKTYPDQSYPSTLNPAEADSSELTEDGHFKYFEYELSVSDLIPGVTYCYGVTATDFGFPQAGVAPFESSVDMTLICMATSGGCCIGQRGNVDGSLDEAADISDLVGLVSYVFYEGDRPGCEAEADLNDDNNIDLVDIVILVDYFFRGGPPPIACP